MARTERSRRTRRAPPLKPPPRSELEPAAVLAQQDDLLARWILEGLIHIRVDRRRRSTSSRCKDKRKDLRITQP